MKERVKEFFLSDWTITEKCLLAADILLTGILLGWLTSPLKKGLHLFSDNTWDINTPNNEEEEES
ncbi:MAG: hypothetical protein SOY73_04920 [Blautia sp.]|nr:hypothetical protein [Blautia sp.]MDY3998432.1 hypothetical protein [Blautia sp.]